MQIDEYSQPPIIKNGQKPKQESELNQPPFWNDPDTAEDKKDYRARALAYLMAMQQEAKKNNQVYETKYSQMTETEKFEDALEDLKERLEKITISPKADVR